MKLHNGLAIAGIWLGILFACQKKESPIAVPQVTTIEVTNISVSSAQGGGKITSMGGGNLGEFGICWSISDNPQMNDSKIVCTDTAHFFGKITNIKNNTRYYVRAYASNEAGVGYGNVVSFQTTAIVLPQVTTNEITNILPSTAQGSGKIISTGGGTVSEFGICWSTSSNPQITGSKIVCTDTAHIQISIPNLVNNTRYYVRAYASNEAGVGYGNEVSFVANKVSDIHGNIYTSVAIGSQVWLVENLKVSKYRNGDDIENSSDTTTWRTKNAGLYCNYQNDESLVSTYGRLYNWAAVNDARGIAPEGWHVASKTEWETLITTLGGKDLAAGAMKETGTTHWTQPNVGATNSSGFTALPGGYFYFYESMSEGSGILSYWWSSTEDADDKTTAYSFNLGNGATRIVSDNPEKVTGFSVRCVKN